jgi:hypothetical protein
MVDKSKSKAAMLLELESIKGLLRDEDDDIPILQEIPEHVAQDHYTSDHHKQETEHHQTTSPAKTRGEQRDFFNSSSMQDSAAKLLDSLSDFEKTTQSVTATKTATVPKQTPLAKANGENPFLPEHIRSRLHGNNPPPLFEIEAARKIATTSKPKTLLGSTHVGDSYPLPSSLSAPAPTPAPVPKLNMSQHAMIEDIVDNLLPVLEKELRERLEFMTKEMLEDLLEKKQ